jgi:hypothetical protein
MQANKLRMLQLWEIGSQAVTDLLKRIPVLMNVRTLALF